MCAESREGEEPDELRAAVNLYVCHAQSSRLLVGELRLALKELSPVCCDCLETGAWAGGGRRGSRGEGGHMYAHA